MLPLKKEKVGRIIIHELEKKKKASPLRALVIFEHSENKTLEMVSRETN